VTVEEVMRRDPVVVAPEDSLAEVAARLTDEGVGAALVSDFGRMIGIVTERDIMRAVAYRTHSADARAREWMTRDPITVDGATNVEEAARIMLERRFRHLPVVDGDRPIGIVSLRRLTEATFAQPTNGKSD
jgi:CBS domain-containing protein